VSYPDVRNMQLHPLVVAIWSSFTPFDDVVVAEAGAAARDDSTGTIAAPRERSWPGGSARPVFQPWSRPLLRQTLSPQEIYRRVAPSVYLVVAGQHTSESDLSDLTLGSAVAISEHLALTNCHVLENGTFITIWDGDKGLHASLRFADIAQDRCVLEADGALRPIAGTARYVDLEVGDPVFAIGNPSGLERSFSEGRISGLRHREGTRYVQITAPISKGSSGGALVDEQGKLIGITTTFLPDAQNINFAIAVDEFCKELEDACRVEEVSAR
jgi:S1-C subfamily serine protease